MGAEAAMTAQLSKDISFIDENSGTIVANVFIPDRRPIAGLDFATQRTTSLVPATTATFFGMTWGEPTASFRRTPAVSEPDSAFTVAADNGRLAYVNAKVENKYATWGFERLHMWNIAGYTNSNTAANLQDYFSATPYTGLFLDSVDYIATKDSTVGAVPSASPFTPDGTPNLPRGDNERAWIAAVNRAKDLVLAEGGTPEIGCYTGYRPNYTDATMGEMDKSYLGMDPSWTGTGDSPSFAPDVAFDYVDANDPGYSASTAAFNAWWAPEVAGLLSMGFDALGLDTGSKIWLNSAGMSNTGTGANASDFPSRVGDSRLVDDFNALGIQSYGEAIPMYSYGVNGKALGVTTAGNEVGYEVCPYMGFFWQQVSYNGLDEFGAPFQEGISVGGGLYVHNLTGTDGGATVGLAADAFTFNPATTEVHCIVQWGDASAIQPYLDIGWTTLKQVLYDTHQAGFVVGVSASTSATMTDGQGYAVTPLEFFTYVQDLSKGLITTRPEGAAPGTQSLTFAGSPTVTSQVLTVGDAAFDQLGITKIDQSFGIAAVIHFDTDSNRDVFLTSYTTMTLGGVNLLAPTYDNTNTLQLSTTDAAVIAAIVGTTDLVWI